MSSQVATNVAIIVTPVLLAGAILFAYTQWRSAQNARTAEIILAICEKWDSRDMEKCRRAVNMSGEELKDRILKADANDSEELYDLITVANFFDTLGCMVVEGLLDYKKGYQLFGPPVEHYYGRYAGLLSDETYAGYYRYFIRLYQLFDKEKRAEKEKQDSQIKPPGLKGVL